MQVFVKILSGEVIGIPIFERCHVINLRRDIADFLRSRGQYIPDSDYVMLFTPSHKYADDYDFINDSESFYVLVNEPPIYTLNYNDNKNKIELCNEEQVIMNMGGDIVYPFLDKHGRLKKGNISEEGYKQMRIQLFCHYDNEKENKQREFYDEYGEYDENMEREYNRNINMITRMNNEELLEHYSFIFTRLKVDCSN